MQYLTGGMIELVFQSIPIMWMHQKNSMIKHQDVPWQFLSREGGIYPFDIWVVHMSEHKHTQSKRLTRVPILFPRQMSELISLPLNILIWVNIYSVCTRCKFMQHYNSMTLNLLHWLQSSLVAREVRNETNPCAFLS